MENAAIERAYLKLVGRVSEDVLHHSVSVMLTYLEGKEVVNETLPHLLARICKNTQRDLHKRKVMTTYNGKVEYDAYKIEKTATYKSCLTERELVLYILSKLDSKREKQVFVFRFIKRHTAQEIADRYGVDVRTVYRVIDVIKRKLLAVNIYARIETSSTVPDIGIYKRYRRDRALTWGILKSLAGECTTYDAEDFDAVMTIQDEYNRRDNRPLPTCADVGRHIMTVYK